MLLVSKVTGVIGVNVVSYSVHWISAFSFLD